MKVNSSTTQPPSMNAALSTSIRGSHNIIERLRCLRPVICMTVVLFLLCASVGVFGQSPEKKPTNPQQTDAQGGKGLEQTDEVKQLPDKANRFAIIIGINDYSDDQINHLNYAVNDAKLLRDTLIEYAGFDADNVHLLTTDPKDKEPTRSNIFAEIHRLKAQMGKDSLLVVAFSGHGMQQETGQPYLLPKDASAIAGLIEDTAIPVSRLRDLINDTGAGQVILAIDACRNVPVRVGARGEAEKMSSSYKDAADFKKINSGIRAFVTLFASSPGQIAWEDKKTGHGYFTLALVEALKGQASNKESGEITLKGVLDYVQKEVPRRVQREGKPEQTPWPIRDGFADNLVLARDRAWKPAVVVVTPPPVAPKPAEPVKPATGTLTVLSNPKAVIHIESEEAGVPPIEKTVEANDSSILLDLKPGRYRITAALNGYVTKSTESPVEVVAGPNKAVSMLLDLATSNVVIRTNVQTGVLRYRMTDKTLSTEIPIKDGRAEIKGLLDGAYEVMIVAEGYQPRLPETIRLPGKLEHVINLEKLSTQEFWYRSDSLNVWDNLPNGWYLKPIKPNSKINNLVIDGAGMALLRDDNFRHYADFMLRVTLGMVDKTDISFVVRARDANNYYKIQLTGAKSNSPATISSFIVKDGAPQSLGEPLIINDSQKFLKPGNHIFIKMDGSKLNIWVVDNDTTNHLKKSWSDSASSFHAGAIGISADKKDHVEISEFLICAANCAEPVEP